MNPIPARPGLRALSCRSIFPLALLAVFLIACDEPDYPYYMDDSASTTAANGGGGDEGDEGDGGGGADGADGGGGGGGGGGGDGGDGTGCTTVPAAPASIAATAGNAQVTVNWSEVTGATGYNLYWSNIAGVTTASASIAGVVSPYDHTSLENGTRYYYRVAAFDGSCESALSTEVNAMPVLPATVIGEVVDATDGTLLSDITVDIAVCCSDVTGASGEFGLILVPAGSQTIGFTGSGYIPYQRTVTVPDTGTLDLGPIPLSPILPDPQIRVVLSWAAIPDDLDLHLLTPTGVSSINTKNPNGTGDDAGTNLDLDAVNGFGPETITIAIPQSGTYTVYVHNFNDFTDTAFSASGAWVDVYSFQGQETTVMVRQGAPCTSASNDYWHVLTLDVSDSTTVNSTNTCSTSPP